MITDDCSRNVTREEYWRQISIYTDLATNIAKSDLSKLAELIARSDDLPSDARDQVLRHLESDHIMLLSEEQKLPLWTELVTLVVKHRKFSDAEWAMEAEEVEKIAAVAERLVPQTPAVRHRRLFSNLTLDLFEEKGNYQEQEKKLLERRQQAIKEIWESGGVQAVMDFAQYVESPMHVGIAFGAVADGEAERAVLPELLETTNKSLSEFSGGFIWGRYRALGWGWGDGVDSSEWTPAQVGQLFAHLPFEPETWQRASHLLGPDESAYWTKVPVNPYGVQSGLESAADRLVQHGRPYAAVACLAAMCHQKQPIGAEQAARALLAAVKSSESAHATDAHDLCTVIRTLQENPDTNPEDLFQVEWAYLRLLARDRASSPMMLEQRLAEDPAFFCEAIRIVYRSKKEKEPAKEVSEKEKDIGANVYLLLSKWRRVPGTTQDGSFDGNALLRWLNDVKKACSKSGHVEVALITVGHVLAHMPSDPDGLWIHRAGAEVLNAEDANHMRRGFTIELSNSRGAYPFTAGREEREIAQKYRTRAEEVETAGYQRLAAALRDLACQYERQAERDERRDPLE